MNRRDMSRFVGMDEAVEDVETEGSFSFYIDDMTEDFTYKWRSKLPKRWDFSRHQNFKCICFICRKYTISLWLMDLSPMLLLILVYFRAWSKTTDIFRWKWSFRFMPPVSDLWFLTIYIKKFVFCMEKK